MVCAIDSTCSSKHAKWGFGFVRLNRFAVQNIFIGPQKLSPRGISSTQTYGVWSVPYHLKARIKAVLEMSAAQSFTQRSLIKGRTSTG
jgi:hypothetical protein